MDSASWGSPRNAPGPADRHRPTDRHDRVRDDGGGVRGQQGRDSRDACVINAFKAAQRLCDVTVVAEPGMIYTTNPSRSAEFVIGAFHRLWRIEKSLRMPKHDLQVRPIYRYKRESIEAHLNIVFAALAINHWIERQTCWKINKFVQTTRRYHTVHIRAGNQTLTAAEPYPPTSTRPGQNQLARGSAH
jgi:hypothetical protein